LTFDSYTFLLLFAPVAIAIFWCLPPGAPRLWWLLAAGYAYYASFDWRFLPLLAVVTLVTYVLGNAMAAGGPRRVLLGLSVTLGLLPLVLFKYRSLLDLAFPIGLSFYTFQALTYGLDIFHGRGPRARSLFYYAPFVSFFPTLLAGPIARWSQLGPALPATPRWPRAEGLVDGLFFVVVGLAEKTLLADPLERNVVAPLFEGGPHGFWVAWVAALAYGARLYFDFAGYSDMAVGLGRLLGFSLPRNFALPYQARDIGNFWERWHISLSSWFRDYLFYPVSRALLRATASRQPGAARAASYALTMGLIGLWHGLSAAFLLWGLYHALLLIAFHAARPRRGSAWERAQRPLTFVAVTFGWVLFRSRDLAAPDGGRGRGGRAGPGLRRRPHRVAAGRAGRLDRAPAAHAAGRGCARRGGGGGAGDAGRARAIRILQVLSMKPLDAQHVREVLRTFITTELMRDPSHRLGDGEKIITGGLVDSFSLAELAVFVETAFGVYIPDPDLTVAEMDTLDLIVARVLRAAA
jgi:D-alanyl-lipoteichoic acid acyltransferase DltB (MBOAT superfamily)/acyl carrier protein